MSARLMEWIAGAHLDALLLESAVQGTVVLAAALAAFRASRWASAAWRHFGLTLALAGTLGLPFFRLVTPAAGLPAAIAPAAAGNPAPALLQAPPREPGASTEQTAQDPLSTRSASPRDVVASPVEHFTSERLEPPASGAGMSLWARVTRGRALLLGWLGGVFVVLLPMALGTIRLRTWARRGAGRLGPAWSSTRATLAADHPGLARLRCLETTAGSMPMTWGVLRPTIALPADGESWPEARRRDVLLHELAHVTRRDCLTQSLGRLACAVRWYDPLAWLALRRMRLERERACDDLVLSAGREASDYAESLVAIARQARQRRDAAFAGLAMARRSTLHARIGSLLARDRNRAALTFRHGVATTLGIGAVLVSASSLRARSAPDSPILPAILAATMAPASSPVLLRSESGRSAIEPRIPAQFSTGATANVLPVAPRVSVRDMPSGQLRRVDELATPAASLTMQQSGAAAVCDTGSARSQRRDSNTSHSLSSSRGERVWQVKWSSNGCALVIQARGDVEWTDGLTDVQSISRGGSITIESDDGRTVRRYVVRSRSGALERTYSVDDVTRPFDAEARAWLGAVLVSLDRRTGFAADIRLPRILEREGVDGALREIEHVEGDYARRIYYTKLLALRELSPGELQRALSASAQSVASDYEMAELLIAFAKERGFDAGAYPSYVQALGTIGSSYELRRAASVMLARDDLPPDAVRGILQAAAGIDSDYEKAELLVSMGRRYAVGDATRPIYVEALRSIRGSYERRRVMEMILRGEALDSATVRALVAATRDMRGDYEVAEVLLRLGRYGAATIAMGDFFAVARQIGGDHEKSRVLSAVAGRDDLPAPVLMALLDVAGTVKSDYECASILVAVARKHALTEAARSAFERAAQTIDSDHEYGRALSALRRAR